MLGKFVNWLTGPSKFERIMSTIEVLIQHQQESLRLQSEVLQKVVEASEANAKVLSDYFNMAASASQPQVRVISEHDEAVTEALSNMKKKYERDQKISSTIQGWQGPVPSYSDLQNLFNDMRNELS